MIFRLEQGALFDFEVDENLAYVTTQDYISDFEYVFDKEYNSEIVRLKLEYIINLT